MLKREEILSKTSLKTETLNIEEWGGDVIVSEMSGAMRDGWEQAIREKDASGRLVSPRAKLVVFTIIDEKGNRIFKDDDIEAIGKLSSETLEKICIVSMRLNGLGADEINKAKKN
jgi:hypothetical protein